MASHIRQRLRQLLVSLGASQFRKELGLFDGIVVQSALERPGELELDMIDAGLFIELKDFRRLIEGHKLLDAFNLVTQQ